MGLILKNEYPRLKGAYDDKFMALFILKRYVEFLEDEESFGPLRNMKLISIPSLVMFYEDDTTEDILDFEAMKLLGFPHDTDISSLSEEDRENVFMEAEVLHADFRRDFYRVMEHYHMCYSTNGSYDVSKKEMRNAPTLEVW